jgi:hypothetical protein
MSHSFGSPVQTAWVTHSLDTTEKALTGLLGVKKWVRLPDVHVASISLSYLGDMQLELIEPVSGPNIYSDFLQDSGPGLHHICVEADTLENFDAVLASAAEQGASVPQQGVMPGGLRFAYLSAPQYGVPFVEIAHFSPEMRQFFDYIKQEQQ